MFDALESHARHLLKDVLEPVVVALVKRDQAEPPQLVHQVNPRLNVGNVVEALRGNDQIVAGS